MEPIDGIITQEVDNIGQAMQIAADIAEGGNRLFFRGQSNEAWEVESSLRRLLREHESLASAEGNEPYIKSLVAFARQLILLGYPLGRQLARDFLDLEQKALHHSYPCNLIFDSDPLAIESWQCRTVAMADVTELFPEVNIAYDWQDVSPGIVQRQFEESRDQLASLAQHYGLRTHLIDFSTSFIVATGMACFDRHGKSDDDSRPAVHIVAMDYLGQLQRSWMYERLFKTYVNRPGEVSELSTIADWFLPYLQGRSMRWIEMPVELNDNQRQQRGVLLSISPSMSLPEALKLWGAGSSAVVHKLIFNCSREELRKQCRLLGTDPASMYNSLQGAAAYALDHLMCQLGNP